MFEIDTDKTISITRGDSGSFVAPIDYALQPGDVLRLKVFRKKACEDVVLQKDFAVEEATETVTLVLTEKDTRIGGIISKPVDYWYEIELNPDNNPKTLVGYDEDGAKIFKLYPEGRDMEDDELTEEEVDTFRKLFGDFKNEIYDYVDEACGDGGADGKDGVSITSVEQTTTSAEDGGNNVITVTLSDDTTSTFTVKNGSKGSQGVQGIQGEKGDKGDTGSQGAKGDKGDKGDTGASGSNGKDGISVTVSKVTESTADGGSNVVTFSDGKTMTIKNGSKGSQGEKGADGAKGDTGATGPKGADGINGKDGYTPKKGVDYYTEEDKAEMVNDVKNVCVAKNQGSANVGKILVVGTDGNLTLANMPEGGASGDVIGTLDESNNILLSGKLADGTYTLKYENADGTYTDVGTLEVGAIVAEPTNLFVVGGDGYIESGRCSSTGADRTDATSTFVTNYIDVAYGDTVYIKGYQTPTASKSYCGVKYADGTTGGFMLETDTTTVKDFSLTNGVAQFTINAQNADYVRFTIQKPSSLDDIVITVERGTTPEEPDTPDEPTYTNLFNSSTCELNMRLNSSGASTEGKGYILTDYIAIPDGVAVGNFRIRYKNAELYQSKSRVGLYDSSKRMVDVQYINGTTLYATGTDDNGVKYVDVLLAEKITASAYVRIAFYSGADTSVSAVDAENIIVTINEEIV